MATEPNPAAAIDGALGDDVLRAVVTALLAAYYRARPGDTRFEKAALAALPAERRAAASAPLRRLIALARRVGQQAETERRQEREQRFDPPPPPSDPVAMHNGGACGVARPAGSRPAVHAASV